MQDQFSFCEVDGKGDVLRIRRSPEGDVLRVRRRSRVGTAGTTGTAGTKRSSHRSQPEDDLDDEVYRLDNDDDTSAPGCGERFVFKGDHKVVIVWNTILAAMLLYIGTVFIYRFSIVTFHINSDGISPLGIVDVGWSVVDGFVDGFFVIDLFLNFFLSYENDKGYEITDMRLIAKRYLRGGFWLNLLACLPEELGYEIVAFVFNPRHDDPVTDLGVTRVYRLQRITKVLRLDAVARFAKLFKLNITIPGWAWFKSFRGVRVMNFILSLLFSCHLLACGWYLTAAFHEDVNATWVGKRELLVNGEETTLLSQGPFDQWMASIYFIFTVFTTVGFGDISANTRAEIAYVVFTMIVGAVVHSIIISEVIQVITGTEKTDEFISKQMQLLEAFALHGDLEKDIFHDVQKDIRDHARRAAEKAAFDKEEMKRFLLSKHLPRSLMIKMRDALHHGRLCKNQFVQICHTMSSVPLAARMPSLMAICLQPADYLPGEFVYQLQDFASHLALVLGGTFAYVGEPSPDGGRDAAPAFADMQGAESEQKLQHSTEDSKWRWIKSVQVWAENSQADVQTNQSAERDENLYPYRLVGATNYFGVLECLAGSVRVATIRCEYSGTVLLLKKRDLLDLTQEFPEYGDVWAVAAWRHESLRIKMLRNLTKKRSYRNLAASTIQQAFRTKEGVASESKRRAGTMRSTGGSAMMGSSNRYSRQELKQMAAPNQAICSLFHEVQELRRDVVTMRAEYRKDTQEMKTALHMLLHNKGLKSVSTNVARRGTFANVMSCLPQRSVPL